MVTAAALALAPVAGAAASDITGSAWKDLSRDGQRQADEPALADQRIYLFDGADNFLRTTTTSASGDYAFAGLVDGDYRVEYDSPSWWALRADWVPTTTGSVRPKISLHLSGLAVANFGWRPIVRSSDLAAPISSYTGPNGLRTESFDDVVSARQVYDVVVQGLVGAEASHTVVRFDSGTLGGRTTTSVGQTNGRYDGFAAISYINYVQWLTDGEVTIGHEYGHAWSLYNAYIVQQDPLLSSYLDARGLAGDPRLNSSDAWSPREMIAEDYRQLLGPPGGRTGSQNNQDIAPAAGVPGLANFLANTFTKPPAGSDPPPPPPLAISALSVSPTPVKTSATIGWTLSAPASVTVVILNSSGAEVRRLLSGASKPAGSLSTNWNRLDSKGKRVARGTYTARVDATDTGGRQATASQTFTVGS